jgi:DNA polymerase III subunit gamma/tau
MFATTEMHKVPQTILSRVQKFMLRKITLDDLIARLQKICDAEGITAERAALEIVARRGEGSVRDSLSLLDQIIAFSGRSISVTDVATILGLSETTFFARVIGHVAEGDHGALLEALQEAADTGRDFKMLYRDLLNFVRNLLLVAGGANESMLGVSPEDLATVRSVAGKFTYTELLRIANLLLRDDETVNRAEHQRLAVEIALLKAATFPRLKSVESVIAAGGPSVAAPSPARPAAPASRNTAASSFTAQDSREPAAPAKAATTSQAPPDAPADPNDLVARVRKQRPLVGGYLAGARMERSGNRLTFVFEESFHADSVGDAKDAIAAIASELFGEKMIVDTRVGAAPEPATGRRIEDKPVPLRDDPVLSAFRKHLGGEVVKEKR